MLTFFSNKQQEEDSGGVGDDREKRKVMKQDTIKDNEDDEKLDNNGITDMTMKAMNDVTNGDDDNENNQVMTVIRRSERLNRKKDEFKDFIIYDMLEK